MGVNGAFGLRGVRWMSLATLEQRINVRYDRYVQSQAHSRGINADVSSEESQLVVYLLDIARRRGVKNTADQVRRTDKLTLGRQFPDPPAKYNRISINRYVTALAKLDFRHHADIQPSITSIYDSLMNSPLLSRLSFKKILRYFAKTYQTLECFNVRDRMIRQGIVPDIETINLLLEATLQKHHPRRETNTMENLQILDKYHLVPNRSTFHAMYKGLRDSELKEEIYRKMQEMGLSQKGIETEVAKQMLARNEEPQKAMRFLQRHIKQASTLEIGEVIVRQLLGENRAKDAWNVILQVCTSSAKKSPSFRLVRILLWHFISTGEIYNAIALTNHLKSRYPEYEDLENWKFLVQRLHYLDRGEYWDLMAKKLYQLNYRVAKYAHETVYFSGEEIAKINSASSDPKFDIRQPFDNNIEQLVMDEIFARLNWKNHPELELEKNTPNFIEAAKLLIQ
ncbi:hypothetical protein OGAPHI_002064 [Ogataea philodendri]|uniref:Uncharacterized protein n=1 Tax=Ogataea philodendri TaxID=1378263 RepID=A0A9P8PAR0_9ASCO|nr:uncharacterized protein OGAPHI_002064 [Ogataea philodendri]KAH3668310.1 hypothetical protein OGAPHI_002064 [Ogataea philodendri]